MSGRFRSYARRPPSFDSGVVEEPLLLFGGRKEHVDPKTGLSLFGPYSLSGQNKPTLSSITVGIIGPGNMVADAQQWLNAVKGLLTNDGSQPYLYPHFPGFNSDLPFQCDFVHGDTWNESLKSSDLTHALEPINMTERINRVVDLYIKAVETLSQREPKPTVILLCLPQNVVDACTTKITGPIGRRISVKRPTKPTRQNNFRDGDQLSIFSLLGEDVGEDLGDSWEYENLRRGLKAEAMRFGIPTQIVWPRAIELVTQIGGRGTKKAQDVATRAWNFTTALYHKAGGSPWRLAKLEPGVCYVGISFYRESGAKGSQLRTSMAQAFTSAGDGYVLRGNPIPWNEDTQGRSPHMDKKSAAALLNDVLELYKKQSRGSLPNRLVIHKTSRFSEDEISGFDSVSEIVPRRDYVALGWRNIQFYRTGMYPPLRGTYVKFSDSNLLLYTSGYVPFLKTYPSIRVPQPVEILEHHGDSPWNIILEEVLALTKMNWNTSDFSNAKPITLAFSQKVGRILAELPPNVQPRPEYRFYM
ncbi:MAG: argonaute/piwi family protein [Bdellovibrionales bacterium]